MVKFRVLTKQRDRLETQSGQQAQWTFGDNPEKFVGLVHMVFETQSSVPAERHVHTCITSVKLVQKSSACSENFSVNSSSEGNQSNNMSSAEQKA